LRQTTLCRSRYAAASIKAIMAPRFT